MPAKIDTFSDKEFAQIVMDSVSMLEIAKKMGYTSQNGSTGERIRHRIDALNLSTEHFSEENRRPIKRTAENIFIENSTADQRTLRRHFLQGEYTLYQCAICGQLPIWQGKELTLILDHINGRNHDNRLDNLRWVCPNCNQQLDTTGSKNWIIQKQYEK